QLEVVLLDAVTLAEPVHGARGVEPVAQDGGVDIRRRVVEAGEAAPLEVDRENAREPGAARIEIADRGAREGGRPGVRRAHGCREVDDLADRLGTGVAESRAGAGRGDRPPGAGGVPLRTRRRRPAEPRADLVPRDEALDQTR